MPDTLAPVLFTALIVGVATVLGTFPVRKLIQIVEAKHELKQGSASFLRTMSGWVIIALWLATTWFMTTITGDWWATGDLDGALARSSDRFRILLEVLAALSND